MENFQIVPLVVPAGFEEDPNGLPAFLIDYQNAAKNKYIEMHKKNEAQLFIDEGKYYLEYYRLIGSNQPVINSSGKLVTAKSNPDIIFIKRHPAVGGISGYETLQDAKTGRWVNATTTGNTLVADEKQATWFQILGAGGYFLIQYFNPSQPTTSYQLGVKNGPIGTALNLVNSFNELFALKKP